MRTLAIGDIHGCPRPLQTLLDAVRIRPDDTLVVLGDFVDRGPATREVIEMLMSLEDQAKVVVLRGNHEAVMLQARRDPDARHFWLRIGGLDVLDSYGTPNPDEIPEAHWAFLEATRPWFETETHIFVHGNLDPLLDLKDQPEELILWDRFERAAAHRSGKVMVCGHTPQPKGRPCSLGYAVCIDTNACRGGWLTCLDVERGFYWQANERGETRTDILAKEAP